MDTLQLILCIALMVLAVFLVIVVLMQSGKNDKLSGTISGSSSDSFYGKAKGRTADAILSKLTAIAAVVFSLIVIAVYVIQARPAATPETDGGSTQEPSSQVDGGSTQEPTDQTEDPAQEAEEPSAEVETPEVDPDAETGEQPVVETPETEEPDAGTDSGIVDTNQEIPIDQIPDNPNE